MRALVSATLLGVGWLLLYPQPAPAAPVDAPATITMMLPADAQVWFDDTKTSQDGAYRRFVSPPLAAGHTYTYHVRIASASDPSINATRALSVRGGDRINLDLRGASGQRGVGAGYYEPEGGPTAAPVYRYAPTVFYSGNPVRSFAEQSPYGGYSWGPWPFPQWNLRAEGGPFNQQ
jgi:uncharacterized protein (TIGR03000 family)